MSPFSVDSVRISPQFAVETGILCYDNKSYGLTLPAVTLICDKDQTHGALLKHESYHFWNHYSEYGIPFMLAYPIATDQFEDYRGAVFGTIDHTPNYYLFGWDRREGWNFYQQLYFNK